ncbi:MAG: hypothetical protein WEB52_11520 [Dehalococcoidia bacterium]
MLKGSGQGDSNLFEPVTLALFAQLALLSVVSAGALWLAETGRWRTDVGLVDQRL